MNIHEADTIAIEERDSKKNEDGDHTKQNGEQKRTSITLEWTYFYAHINEYESIRFRKLTVYELTLFYVVNVKQPDSELSYM
ncbi:hypothetical protein T07_10779, partial [Trichinella nelsoni]